MVGGPREIGCGGITLIGISKLAMKITRADAIRITGTISWKGCRRVMQRVVIARQYGGLRDYTNAIGCGGEKSVTITFTKPKP
ncbi:hypothetical protein BBBOND_0305120 [Babesia bigemina]|uniref:Uncharacterized protein n=1 Tax=Babesia bigemina TaxID=5866 RepID=A0A061DCB0_BABBI|nr:hypothetical protein BBBOND_0305120 [Babesia bigemina]CDR96609.1 hypothetical protein BBBOND_0305120 [Babesia bigemina]|eukprot:XP_012768795.1 hypothetical protein BBBOND_0305120 [Babesia bigemina]